MGSPPIDMETLQVASIAPRHTFSNVWLNIPSKSCCGYQAWAVWPWFDHETLGLKYPNLGFNGSIVEFCWIWENAAPSLNNKNGSWRKWFTFQTDQKTSGPVRVIILAVLRTCDVRIPGVSPVWTAADCCTLAISLSEAHRVIDVLFPLVGWWIEGFVYPFYHG